MVQTPTFFFRRKGEKVDVCGLCFDLFVDKNSLSCSISERLPERDTLRHRTPRRGELDVVLREKERSSIEFCAHTLQKSPCDSISYVMFDALGHVSIFSDQRHAVLNNN